MQSAHTEGARTGHNEIAVLYEGLVRASPTVGALVGRAAALAEARGPAAGLAALEAIDPDAVKSYQPAGPSVHTSCNVSDLRARRSMRSIVRSV